MLNKSTILIVLASLFGGIVAYSHPDWFHRRPIQITHRFHAFGGRFDAGGVAPLMFEFDRKLKITSIEVLPLNEALTNKSAHPLWHLVSESNSVPTRGFLYGMEVPGMRPAQNGIIADPLDPNERYRLVIKAGSLKGEHDFDLDPSPH